VRAAPDITFGMIVLNGMPFLPYSLRTLYPFAARIVVAEGAVPGAATIAGPDGHSRDGTLDELRRFAAEEDSEGKLVVVTAEDEGHPDGFWPGEKDEQSQVDADEFYLPQHLARVRDTLAARREITAMTFRQTTIWGGLGISVDGWYLHRGRGDVHRLFRWDRGYSYATHRPTTILDDRGRDLREVCWLDAVATRRLGVGMLHYSLLFPRQVEEKVEYYGNWGLYGDWFKADEMRRWLEDSYLTLRRPYRVHNVYRLPSWLQRYHGEHPPEIVRMMADISAGRVDVRTRPLDDAERLLRSPAYVLGREALRLAGPVDDRARRFRWTWGPRLRRFLERRTA
jgi:hypothetical protein